MYGCGFRVYGVKFGFRVQGLPIGSIVIPFVVYI